MTSAHRLRKRFLVALEGSSSAEPAGGWWGLVGAGGCRAFVLGAAGGLVLFLYGVLPTFQPAHFGRVYAAYGGVFVILSLLWGWWIDGTRPDGADWIGAALCVAGVGVIMYWPRTG